MNIVCTILLEKITGGPSAPLAIIPKKCLTLGLCLECETFIRGVFCPNLWVCLCVCVFVCMSAFFEKNK